MSDLLSSLQPFLDRLAAELTTTSIILLLGLCWSGLVGYRKTGRINQLTDRLFELSESHIKASEGTVHSLNENTDVVRTLDRFLRSQNGASNA